MCAKKKKQQGKWIIIQPPKPLQIFGGITPPYPEFPKIMVTTDYNFLMNPNFPFNPQSNPLYSYGMDNSRIFFINLNSQYFYWFVQQNKIEMPTNLYYGEVLVKHPYLTKYIPIEDAEEELFRYKMENFRKIAQQLGVKKLGIHTNVESTSQRTICADGHVEVLPVVNTALDYNSEKIKQLFQNYRKIDTFEGTVSEDAVEKAKKIADDCGLSNEESIKELIDLRNSENPLKSRAVRMEVSKEYNEAVDFAFKLKFLGWKFNTDFDSLLARRNTVVCEFYIEF